MRHPGDAPRLGKATTLGAIGLDNIHRLLLEQRHEALPAGQHFASGNGHRRMLAELGKTSEVVWPKRLLEPCDIVVGQHLRCFQGPLVTVGPVGVATARIDHQFDIGANGIARCAHQNFIHPGADPAKGLPA